ANARWARSIAFFSFQSIYFPLNLDFMKLSKPLCAVKFQRECAFTAQLLSQARSEIEKLPSKYFIQCHHPVGMKRVSPCSRKHSMPSMPSNAGNFSKSGCSIS